MKIHIGNIALGNLEFLETVIAKISIVVAQYLLGIDIMYLPAGGQGIFIRIRNDGSETRCGLEHNTHRHQRHDPMGCRTGMPCRVKGLLQDVRLCQRSGIHTACYCLRMCRQLADDTSCIILAVVLRDFGNDHVAFSSMTPDYFERLIHKLTPI